MNLVSDNRKSVYIMALASCIVGGVTAIVSTVSTARKYSHKENTSENESAIKTRQQPLHNIDIINPRRFVPEIKRVVEQSLQEKLAEGVVDQSSQSPRLRIHEALIIPNCQPYYIPSSNNGIEFATEKKCRKIIEEYFQAPFPKKSNFCRNPLTKAPLELDGYNESLKVAFEYQGEQHYDENHKFWKTKREYQEQRFRDRVKKVMCERRSIHLIIIPYTAKVKSKGGLDNVLMNYLQNHFPHGSA